MSGVILMGRYEDLIDSLYELFAEEDQAERVSLLDRTVTEDIEFYGLQDVAIGREEFAASFRGSGSRLVRTSLVDLRDRWLRNTWVLRLADGAIGSSQDGRPYAGLQISELAADGRIRRLIPFLGDTPPAVHQPATSNLPG